MERNEHEEVDFDTEGMPRCSKFVKFQLNFKRWLFGASLCGNSLEMQSFNVHISLPSFFFRYFYFVYFEVKIASLFSEGRPKRGRKRKIPQQSRADRKWLYNNNKTHVNMQGNIVEEKLFNENFVCSCRKRCTASVPLKLRKRLFTQFWRMGKFNLRFKKPKKDTCKKCDIYKAKVESANAHTRQLLEERHDSHLDQAVLLQATMKKDLAEAANDPEVEVISEDTQKMLTLPKMLTSIVYYKRQLNLYNLGIHVGSTGKGYG